MCNVVTVNSSLRDASVVGAIDACTRVNGVHNQREDLEFRCVMYVNILDTFLHPFLVSILVHILVHIFGAFCVCAFDANVYTHRVLLCGVRDNFSLLMRVYHANLLHACLCCINSRVYFCYAQLHSHF